MNRQGQEEDDREFQDRVRDGQFPNRVVLRRDTKTKLLIFVFSFDYNNKLNKSIRSSGVLLETGRVFSDIHICGDIL